ncbi:MAG: zinc-ribbon domain containing protein [Saprospiraceae bacterium]|nr:zinc-ribbon domain containing protein [Saprospiraceae bacterium]
MECEKCGENFIFEKEEQQYWYEVLKFWVQSFPKNCKKCREILKQEKDLNNKLSKILKNLNKNNPGELIEISQLYFEMNKFEKGKYYATFRKAMQKKRKIKNRAYEKPEDTYLLINIIRNFLHICL